MAQTGQDNLRNAFRMLADGRIAGLETIWRELARPLHGYAFALTADHDQADDVLGEVVAKVLRSGWRLRWVRNLRAYLFAAVRNAGGDRAERKTRAECIWP